MMGQQEILLAGGQSLTSSVQRGTARESEATVRPLRAVAGIVDHRARFAGQSAEQTTEQGGERPARVSRAPQQPLPRVYADYRPAAFAGGFLAQLLSQSGEFAAAQEQPAAGHNRALGNDAYRRAGGEPALYSDAPALFRIAV